MPNVNKVILIGNLTRDPEIRVTPKGTSVCQFGLAVNREFTNETTKEKQEEVTFIDLEAWGKQAETIAKYCIKGRPIYVEGRLKFDQWEDKTNGQKRSKLKVVLETFQFIGEAKPGNGARQENDRRSEPSRKPQPSESDLANQGGNDLGDPPF